MSTIAAVCSSRRRDAPLARARPALRATQTTLPTPPGQPDLASGAAPAPKSQCKVDAT